MRILARFVLALTTAAGLALAQVPDCNAPAASPSVTIDLPTNPFAVALTKDGCWVFVSGMAGADRQTGIVVLKREGGHIAVSRMVPLPSQTATGMTLTHDGKLLVVAASASVDFLDVAALVSGTGQPLLGSLSDGNGAASIYANVTGDDKLLFVSDEGSESITVIDLARARASGYKAGAIIGKIPVGLAPIALTFSLDGKWLYTTSEGAAPDWRWPAACKPEGNPRADAPISNPEGAVIVVDVSRAAKDPAHAVAARVAAGCSPVRMAIAPGGERIYVTARNNNGVLAFDTAKLVTDPQNARLGMVPVGAAPVPVAVIDGGRKIVVGNSNRFAGRNDPQSLTVVDASKMQDGAAAVLGTISTGAFPREMAVSPDGRTLFVTNAGSHSLQMVDIGHLPLVSTNPRQ